MGAVYRRVGQDACPLCQRQALRECPRWEERRDSSGRPSHVQPNADSLPYPQQRERGMPAKARPLRLRLPDAKTLLHPAPGRTLLAHGPGRAGSLGRAAKPPPEPLPGHAPRGICLWGCAVCFFCKDATWEFVLRKVHAFETSVAQGQVRSVGWGRFLYAVFGCPQTRRQTGRGVGVGESGKRKGILGCSYHWTVGNPN